MAVCAIHLDSVQVICSSMSLSGTAMEYVKTDNKIICIILMKLHAVVSVSVCITAGI